MGRHVRPPVAARYGNRLRLGLAAWAERTRARAAAVNEPGAPRGRAPRRDPALLLAAAALAATIYVATFVLHGALGAHRAAAGRSPGPPATVARAVSHPGNSAAVSAATAHSGAVPDGQPTPPPAIALGPGAPTTQASAVAGGSGGAVGTLARNAQGPAVSGPSSAPAGPAATTPRPPTTSTGRPGRSGTRGEAGPGAVSPPRTSRAAAPSVAPAPTPASLAAAPSTPAASRASSDSFASGSAGHASPGAGAASGGGTQGRSGGTLPLSPTLAAQVPGLQAPLQGTVLSPFGWSFSPVFRDWQEHTGVDLAAGMGDPVGAPADGVVLAARDDALWGWVVSIALAQGHSSNLSGLGSVAVAAGEYVRAGQTVGTVGPSPPAEGDLPPHVFWQVFDGTTPVNPLATTATGGGAPTG